MNDGTDAQEEALSLNENNLSRVIGWVSVADGKAQFVFSIALVSLAYLVPRIGTIGGTILGLWEGGAYVRACALGLLAMGTVCCLIVSVVHVLLVIYPKTKIHNDAPSYFFFETIADISAAEFRAKMSSISTAEAINGLSDQTYNNAKVVKKKFDGVSSSIIWLGAGIGLAVAVLLLHEMVLLVNGTQ